MDDQSANETVHEEARRPTRRSLLRGWRRRCPSCGTGPMYRGYLAVRHDCSVCGLELHHQRADDGPAFLTILIVGHIFAPVMAWVYFAYEPEPLLLATSFSLGSVTLALYLLPRIKGAMIGFQWAKRLHGFGAER